MMVKCVWMPRHRTFSVVSRFGSEAFSNTIKGVHGFCRDHQLTITGWFKQSDDMTLLPMEDFTI